MSEQGERAGQPSSEHSERAGQPSSEHSEQGASSRPDLLTFGETMAVVRGDSPGPLQHNAALRLSCAGAESNVAVGLARLGHHAVWVGRTGDDELGDMVRATLRGTGVEVRSPVDPQRPTGLMLRSARTARLIRVHYYRRGSAGSSLAVDDVEEPLSRRPRILHATGITPALSAGARSAVLEAVATARDSGTVVSYDVNYRSRLTTVAEAAELAGAVLDHVDIVFCGEDELPVLATALGTPGAGTDELLTPRWRFELVVKRGGRGASAAAAGATVSAPAIEVPIVDVVGAGDAFVAGYLSGYLDGLPVAERLHRAVRLGAFCVSTHGDWEGLPTRAELDLLDRSPDHTDR
jgi:2-dehydro-3-deoxygluconokinase